MNTSTEDTSTGSIYEVIGHAKEAVAQLKETLTEITKDGDAS